MRTTLFPSPLKRASQAMAIVAGVSVGPTLKRAFQVTAIVAGVSVVQGVTTPAQAGIPVFDWAAIIQRAAQIIEHLTKWTDQLKKMRENYSLAYAAYNGIKNWDQMGWIDILNMTEMPWFDGVEGIEDIRDLSALTEMGVQELMSLYKEMAILDRMANDPKFMANQAARARLQFTRKMSQKRQARRVAFSRQLKKHLKEQDRLLTQAKAIQTQIELKSKMEPAPMGALQALEGKLSLIQVKMTNSKWAIEAQEKMAAEKERNDIESYRSDFMELNLDMEAYLQNKRTYWDAFLER